MATLSELIAQHCADLTDYEAIAAHFNAPTANAISAQTATALAMLLQRTQPDPAWAATIAGPSLAQAAVAGQVRYWVEAV